jgi:hypothetical protein
MARETTSLNIMVVRALASVVSNEAVEGTVGLGGVSIGALGRAVVAMDYSVVRVGSDRDVTHQLDAF